MSCTDCSEGSSSTTFSTSLNQETKMRRGSSYYQSYRTGLLDQFAEGDVVTNVHVGDDFFFGVVTKVSRKENKVHVSWGGAVSQHDPEEVQPADVSASMASRIRKSIKGASKVAVLKSRRETAKSESEAEADPQFVGDPEVHGLDEPRGGGFSIMQDLQEDLHEESEAEVGTAPKMAELKSRRGTLILASQKTDVPPKVSSLRSRRALYHCETGRLYRMTRGEKESGVASCPKCKGEMGLHPYTRSLRIWICDGCGWKISTDNVIASDGSKKASEEVFVSAAAEWKFGHVYYTYKGRLSDLSPEDLIKKIKKGISAMEVKMKELQKQPGADVSPKREMGVNSVARNQITLSYGFDKNEGVSLDE